MAMVSHLWLEGENQGPIAGSVDQVGREDSILVQALEHEVYIPRDPQSGQPTGKRIHNALKITKVFDRSSPKLFQALTSGERMKHVTLKFYRIDSTGTEEHYYTIRLEEAIVVSIRPWIPNCLDPASEPLQHMEDVSFTYRKIIWTWVSEGIESQDDWKEPRS